MPALKKLCDDATAEQDILWIALMLYDEVAPGYLFRTLRFVNDQYAALPLLLYGSAEAFYKNIWDDKWSAEDERFILDLSDVVRRQYLGRGEDPDYSLILSSGCAKDCRLVPKTVDASEVMSCHDIKERVAHLQRSLRALAKKYPNQVRTAAQNGFLALDQQLRDNFSNEQLPKLRKQTFYAATTALPVCLVEALRGIISQINIISERSDPPLWKIANYFIWLGATHPELAVYTVRHLPNFRVASFEQEDRRLVLLPSGFVIASRKTPSDELVAHVDLTLTHILGPLSDYYGLRVAKERAKQERVAGLRADFVKRVDAEVERATTDLAVSTAVARRTLQLEVVQRMRPNERSQFLSSISSISDHTRALELFEQSDFSALLQGAFWVEHEALRKKTREVRDVLGDISRAFRPIRDGFCVLAIFRRWFQFEKPESMRARWCFLPVRPPWDGDGGSAAFVLGHLEREPDKGQLEQVRDLLGKVQVELEAIAYFADKDSRKKLQNLSAKFDGNSSDDALLDAWKALRTAVQTNELRLTIGSSGVVSDIQTQLENMLLRNSTVQGDFPSLLYAFSSRLYEGFTLVRDHLQDNIRSPLDWNGKRITVVSRLLREDPWEDVLDPDTEGLEIGGWHLAFRYPLDNTWWNPDKLRSQPGHKLPSAFEKLEPYFRLIAIDACGKRHRLVRLTGKNGFDPHQFVDDKRSSLLEVLPDDNDNTMCIHLLARVPWPRLTDSEIRPTERDT